MTSSSYRQRRVVKVIDRRRMLDAMMKMIVADNVGEVEVVTGLLLNANKGLQVQAVAVLCQFYRSSKNRSGSGVVIPKVR